MLSQEKQKKEYIELEQRVQELEGKYSDSLIMLLQEYEDSIEILQELKDICRKLEMQNNYLKSENQEYHRKISMITDTMVGKIGINTYRKMKRLKTSFTKRMKRVYL